MAKDLFLKKMWEDLGLEESNFFLNGAAPLKQHTVNFFSSLNLPLMNCYGMSETSGIVTISVNKAH